MDFLISLSVSEQFCRDVLCTAIEGGSNYWASFHKPIRKCFGDDNIADYVSVNVAPNEECKGDFQVTTITVDSIANGIQILLIRGDCHAEYRSQVYRAVIEDDAGQIDSELADLVLQSAMFDGDVIYG